MAKPADKERRGELVERRGELVERRGEFIERRSGLADRRIAAEDRRNAERVADDPAPRRDPEISDRRASAAVQRSAAQ